MNKLHYSQLLQIILNNEVERKTLSGFYWNCAPHCADPQRVTFMGRPSPNMKDNDKIAKDFGFTPGEKYTLYLDMDTPCRKCAPCLKRRAAKWRLLANREMAMANRNWFGTLTLSPSAHFKAYLKACSDYAKRGTDLDLCGTDEQFQARVTEIGREITKWLKRVRKNSGAQIRYLLVTEPHKSGLPHFHVLVHQCSDVPVLKRHLKQAWRLGFSDFKLVEAHHKASNYVAKYLSKSLRARVRASQRYGNPGDPSGVGDCKELDFHDALRHSELANVKTDTQQNLDWRPQL